MDASLVDMYDLPLSIDHVFPHGICLAQLDSCCFSVCLARPTAHGSAGTIPDHRESCVAVWSLDEVSGSWRTGLTEGGGLGFG